MAQVAGYQAGHRIRPWKNFHEFHSAAIQGKARRLAGPVTVRQATAEERERFGIVTPVPDDK